MQPVQVKKVYVQPKLAELGDIATLTLVPTTKGSTGIPFQQSF